MIKLVSIIIPVYNAEEYIEECVKHILESTYKNIEIILVNDGSKDNSLKKCKSLAMLDNRIVVVDKSQGGVSSARNAGIDNSHGEYIMFCDNDDYYSHDAVEKYVNCLESNNVDIVCSSFIIKPVEGEDFQYFNDKVLKDEKCNNYRAMERLLLNEGTSSNVWARLYRREIFDDIRFPEGHAYEDVDVSYKCFMKAKEVFFYSEALYFWCRRIDSEFTRKDEAARLDEIRAALNRYNDIRNFYDEKMATYAFSELLFDFIHVYECYIIQKFDVGNISETYEFIKKESAKRKNYMRYLSIRKKIEFLVLFRFKRLYCYIILCYAKMRHYI